MRQTQVFRAPTAYEEEMLKAQRQRQLAEMLQQQAFAPEAEPYTFQGFRAQPSAANAIARVLSAYTAKKIGEKAETAERAAREADIAGAEQVMRGLAPQARVAAPTAAEIAGSVGMPQISEEGTVSYGPTVQPQMRTEMVGPTAQERRDLLTQTMVRGTPMARQLAQFLAAQEPKTTTTEFGNQLLNVTGDVATPVTMGGKPVTSTPKAPPPSDLATLISERRALLPGDPNIPRYDAAIEAETRGKGTTIQMPPTPRDLRRDEKDLRDQLEGRLNKMDWSGTQSAMQRIMTAPKTPAGDVTIVYALAKANDSSGAVREDDFNKLAKSGSLPQQLQALYEEANSGRLTEEKRQELINTALSFYRVRERDVNKLLDDYAGIAKRSNLEIENVIGSFRPTPLWSQEDENELQRLRAEAAKSGGKKP
jgi:hypothetical protein